jgi:predicted DNA-binding transcriptional regulator YafY
MSRLSFCAPSNLRAHFTQAPHSSRLSHPARAQDTRSHSAQRIHRPRSRPPPLGYRKPGSAKLAPRQVQPLHVTHREGRWQLIGHDIDRYALRTYAISRIANVELFARWFERPKGFSIECYFASALGVMNGTENHQVRIRFSTLAADHVRDRFWHESQEFKELSDGRLELSLRLADLLEVERLILQWGGHAEALEPLELRTRLAAAAQTIQATHA